MLQQPSGCLDEALAWYATSGNRATALLRERGPPDFGRASYQWTRDVELPILLGEERGTGRPRGILGGGGELVLGI